MTGVGMGMFAWYAFGGYVPRAYPLHFTHGAWIAEPNGFPQGYFRQELSISGPIHSSWIKIAAPDALTLYVNGKIAASLASPLQNVSGIFDIGPYLKVGKNVIGAQVKRETYPDPARVIIEGAYVDVTGREHPFFSDATWKVASREELQNLGKVHWNSTSFNTDQWSHVQIGGAPLDGEVPHVDLHPRVMTSPFGGKWIGHPDPHRPLAAFERTFQVTHKVEGAWVRLVGEERYGLVINGILVSRGDGLDTGKGLDVYDVGPLITRGTNTIRVSVTAGRSLSPRFTLDLIVSGPGQAETILRTDSTWQTREGEDGQESADSPAVILADFSPSIDGIEKHIRSFALPIDEASRRAFYMVASLILILVMTLLIWKGMSVLIRRFDPDITPHNALTMDAILHVPSLLVCGTLYALTYDIRYDPASIFQGKFVVLIIAVLMLFRAGLLVELGWAGRRKPSERDNTHEAGRAGIAQGYHGLTLTLCALAIGAVTLSLRVGNLETTSLYHDEVGMAQFAQTVLKTGYPTRSIAAFEKPLTTYELIPYPIALSIAIFGASDYAVRFPSTVFAGFTAMLIFYIGVRLWGWWAGILASCIYAFSPFSLLWGTKAFHPQQTQFFALLTSYLFYRAIQKNTPAIQPQYLYGAAVCFILTYLSWEGAGLLLGGFFLSLLAVKGRDAQWVKSGHLWLGLVMIVFVVLAQLIHRTMSNLPYLVLGTGLSSAGFTPTFMTPLYDPLYYVRQFLYSGVHVVLTGLLVVGLPVISRDQGIRYYVVAVMSTIVLLTHFIVQDSVRYVYFIQPFLILPASSIAIAMISTIGHLLKERKFLTVKAVRLLFAATFFGLVFLLTNTTVLHFYRFGGTSNWIRQMHPDIPDIEYRHTIRFVQDHISPGDVIISLMPQMLEYYAGRRSDYYLQTYTSRQVFYDVSGESPVYVDKFIGTPVLRSLSELKDVLSRHRRVWILAMPYAPFVTGNDSQTLAYITTTCRVVYENYKTRVYLFGNLHERLDSAMAQRAVT